MMLSRLFLLVTLLLGLVGTTDVLAGPCTTDADCLGGRICFEGSCTRIRPTESLLRVELAQPIDTAASLFIDERYMGELPWSGIVGAGMHSIRVEAYGRLPSAFQGESRGGMSDTIQVALEPDPAFAAPIPQTNTYGGQAQPTQHNDQGSESDKPGMLFLGLFGGGGYGTAAWGADQSMRPATHMLGGAVFGVRALDDPFWLEIGLAVSSQSIFIQDWIEDWGQFLKLNLGLQLRAMFEVVRNFVFIGAELEPGYAISNRRFAYAGLRFALSIHATEWLEFRVNLGGVYDQELRQKGWIFGGQLIGGVCFRFVD